MGRNLFELEGIEYKSQTGRNLFEVEGIEPPSITEQNTNALSSPLRLENTNFFPDDPQDAITFSSDREFVQREAEDQKDQYRELARTRFSEEQLKEWEDNPIGFFEAGNFIEPEQVIPLGGFKQAADTFGLLEISKKIERGEELDDRETGIMNNFIDKTIEMRTRGFSIGGGIAYYGSQLPAFMLEFAATGGVGKAAQKATLEVTQSVAEKAALAGVTAKAADVAAKSTALTANVLARTAVMPQRYIPTYGERRLNDYMALTDKGEILFQESQETPAMSALKAFGYQAAEVTSELSGVAIGKYVIDPVARTLKTPLIQGVNALPVKLRQSLYQAYKAIQPNATVSKAFSRMGYHGMLQELGEERIADILRETLNLTLDEGYTFEQVLDGITPTKDQLAIEASIIAITGGVQSTASSGLNYLQRRGQTRAEAQEIIDNMTATEQEGLNDSVTPLPKGTNEQSGDPVLDAQIQSLEAQDPPPINDEESTFKKFHRDFVNRLQPIQDIVQENEVRREKVQAQIDADKLTIEQAEQDGQIAIRTPDGESFVSIGSPSGKQELKDLKQRVKKFENLIAKQTGDTGANPFLLSRTYSGVIGTINTFLQFNTSKFNKQTGVFEQNGKGLRPILDDFDNSISHIEPKQKTREQDFRDYLIARRFLEDLEDRDDVEVTEAQIQQSTEDMMRLANKYGENFAWFDEFAQELYGYQQRVLHMLVDADVMSQETYDSIVEKNPNYIPFQRILEEDTYKGIINSSGVFTNANAKKVIKSIHGSDKGIKDPIQSVIANTARILDLQWRNRVALGVADMAPTMPEYIQKTPPTVVKRGETEVIVTFDAGLRRKLEKTIDKFKNTLERMTNIPSGGGGLILGQYSNAEKAVRLRIGTTEGTLAHEVGHMLDYELGLVEKMLGSKRIKRELQILAEQRLSADTALTEKGEQLIFQDRVLEMAPQEYMDYIKNDREIIANMFDAFVNSPEMLAEIAPAAKKKFEEIINSNPDLVFIKQIKPSLERGTETIKREVWSPLDFPPKGTITVFRDGKKEFYEVSEPLLEAMQNLNPAHMSAAMRIITSPFTFTANLLRAGATLIPEFWVRNVLRDQHTAFLQSPIRPTPIDMVYGLTAVIGKNDLYKDWLVNGGSFNSYMELDDKGLEKAYKELFRPQGKLAKYMKNPIRLAADISFGLEQATRVGVFRKTQTKGIQGIEAALMAREATLDFARGGSVSKNINKAIPFFNVGVQGTDKLIRTFKENPKATMLWGTATITVPSILLAGYYLYAAPEEEREEYLNIPQWQKDLFWVAKIDGEWRRYPKPFAFGYLFGAVPERFMHWGYQGDKPEIRDFWQELAMGVGGSLSPVYDASALLPPLVKTTVEGITNYNFFQGREIYPPWMDRLTPEERMRKGTSESAKLLGQYLGISPAVIDNTAFGLLAGSANYALDGGDFVLKKVREWNGEKVPAKPAYQTDIPVIRAFSIRPPTGTMTNSYQNFYKDWEKISQTHATFNRKKGDERQEYFQKHETLIRAYKPMKKFYEKTRDIGKRSDLIYQDMNMDGNEKVKALSKNGEKIDGIVKQANKWHQKNVAEKLKK